MYCEGVAAYLPGRKKTKKQVADALSSSAGFNERNSHTPQQHSSVKMPSQKLAEGPGEELRCVLYETHKAICHSHRK
jgi:hypothetical protein